MAKFKVGDRVKVKGAGVETIKAVYPKGKGSGLDPTQVDMSVDWYETDGSGMIADEDIVGVANSRACNSTNPVVANAMRARNATTPGDLTKALKDLLSVMKDVKIDYDKAKENDRWVKTRLRSIKNEMRSVYENASDGDRKDWDSIFNTILQSSPFGSL